VQVRQSGWYCFPLSISARPVIVPLQIAHFSPIAGRYPMTSTMCVCVRARARALVCVVCGVWCVVCGVALCYKADRSRQGSCGRGDGKGVGQAAVS